MPEHQHCAFLFDLDGTLVGVRRPQRPESDGKDSEYF